MSSSFFDCQSLSSFDIYVNPTHTDQMKDKLTVSQQLVK